MTNASIITYQSNDGNISFDVQHDTNTVWLTQSQMAELFDTTIPNVNQHIKNIFKDKELIESSVIKNFLITALDGKSYQTKHYQLDVIISAGYRVKSRRGTQFRQWATTMLRNNILNQYQEKGGKRAVNGPITVNINNSHIQLSGNTVVFNPRISQGDFDKEKVILLTGLDQIIKRIHREETIASIIETHKNTISNLDDKNAPGHISQFIKELGDENSTTNQLLRSYGVAKNTLSKCFHAGLALLKFWTSTS